MSFIMPKVNLDLIEKYYMRGILSELVDDSGYLKVKPDSQSRDMVKFYHYIILKVFYSDKKYKTPIPRAWYMPHISEQSFTSFSAYTELFTETVLDMIHDGVFYSERYL